MCIYFYLLIDDTEGSFAFHSGQKNFPGVFASADVDTERNGPSRKRRHLIGFDSDQSAVHTEGWGGDLTYLTKLTALYTNMCGSLFSAKN